MFKYLVQDLSQTVRYIPFVILIWVCLVLLVQMINKKRKKRGKESVPFFSTVCFFTYLALMVMITFLSRESGDATGMELQIGASLKINTRNDALVMENILLFIPYGFCWCWLQRRKGFFFNSLFMGFVTSFAIEILQLITGRGIFQLDDIITNTLGCIIGAFLYKCISLFFKR